MQDSGHLARRVGEPDPRPSLGLPGAELPLGASSAAATGAATLTASAPTAEHEVVQDSPASSPKRSRARRRVGLAFGFVIATTLLTALFNAASVHALTGNSDGATVVLEGLDLRHGNLALNGWSLSLDSFWSVDVLFYAGAVLVAGFRSGYVHLIPSLLAALTVLVGVVLSCRGRRGWLAVASATVVLLALALPAHALAFFLLQGPWHVGTTLYCLVAFWLLATGRFGWGWFAAVVLLAAGLLGDLQTLALGVIPVFGAGVVGMLRRRSIREGLPSALAAASSITLAIVVRLVTEIFGTFRVAESHNTVSMAQLEQDVVNFGDWLSALIGVHQGPFGGPVISRVLELPRVLVLLAMFLAVIVAVVELAFGVIEGPKSRSAAPEGEPDFRIDDMVLFGLLASVGVFGLLTLSNNLAYGRYLDPVMVFGAILAGRVLPRLGLFSSRPAVLLGSLAAVVTFGTSLATMAIDLAAPPPRSPTVELERFLAAHHLDEGVGDYWAASIVTLETEGRIVIRPVVTNLSGDVVSDGRQADSHWFSGHSFSFLVFDKLPYGRVTATTVDHTFGAPEHTYRIGEYTVDVWARPIRLSPIPFP